MTPLDPSPNLIDQVYERILTGIADRTLPPGHRIRQNELAERLGVSRQPVSHRPPHPRAQPPPRHPRRARRAPSRVEARSTHR